MEIDYWQTRWQRGETGFHLPRVHPKLMSCWPTICPDLSATVFVPLCGKSLDMSWLLSRGHTVYGVEASELAIRDFFAEQSWQADITEIADFKVFRYQQLTLYCGDYFKLTAARLPHCQHIYDRASLIALPPAVRVVYAKHLQTLISSARMLLLTLVYSQHEMRGPPFAVPPEEIMALYPSAERALLLDHDILAYEPRFAAKGVSALREQAWSLSW